MQECMDAKLSRLSHCCAITVAKMVQVLPLGACMVKLPIVLRIRAPSWALHRGTCRKPEYIWNFYRLGTHMQEHIDLMVLAAELYTHTQHRAIAITISALT